MNLIWHSLILSLMRKMHNFIVQLRNVSFYISYNTVQLQSTDASIRNININTAVSLTIPHKVSASRFCIMKSFKVNVLRWFPVCGTNTQGRVVWGRGTNCRWEKQFRKFWITMPQDLNLAHACTFICICSNGSLYSYDKWHFEPDPALCIRATSDWSASQKQT